MKTEEEIRQMLLEAEGEAKYWRDRFHSRTMDTKENAECLRNYTALRGVLISAEVKKCMKMMHLKQ